MKIGSQLQFEVPDECPENCPYKDGLIHFDQGNTCSRCPIFNTRPVGASGFRLMEPEHWVDDAAQDWQSWFIEMLSDPEINSINHPKLP